MDKLFEAAKFYQDNLVGKRFHLVAGKNKNLIEFDIDFNIANFKHLLGLNKLSDLQISKNSSETSYLQILNNQITLADIEKSEFYDKMEPRLDHFKEIKTTLYSKELMVKSLHGEFNLIRADFMLTKTDKEYGYAHLFFKENSEAISLPVTFIINQDDYYLRNNPNKWTVLSIEEIIRPEKQASAEAKQNLKTHNFQSRRK